MENRRRFVSGSSTQSLSTDHGRDEYDVYDHFQDNETTSEHRRSSATSASVEDEDRFGPPPELLELLVKNFSKRPEDKLTPEEAFVRKLQVSAGICIFTCVCICACADVASA